MHGARDAGAHAARRADPLARLEREITRCRLCPRLVAYREEVGRVKRRAYDDWTYWARPVPGFGDPAARLLLVGLAPGAHGANRTGRMFTGDSSGDFLYPALHRAAFASQPESRTKEDGLRLIDCWIAATARCAPPDNRPLPVEIARCRPYLHRELDLLPSVRVILVLGKIAFDGTLATLRERGIEPAARPVFAHGAEIEAGPYRLMASYHVSRQNTNTGVLTAAMFDAVLARARRALEHDRPR